MQNNNQVNKQKYDSLIFVHIEKCAGTSIKDMLFHAVKKNYLESRIHIPDFTCGSKDHFVFLSDDKIQELKQNDIFCIADHSHYGIVEKKLNLKNPFYFTILREPVSRILSHYYYFNFYQTKKSLLQLDKAEKERFLLSGVVNLTTLKLASTLGWNDAMSQEKKKEVLHHSLEIAKRNLNSMPVFGILDSIPDFISLFNQQNPFDLYFDKALSKSKKNKNKNKKIQPIDADILQQIQDYAYYDMELYAYAKELLKQKVSNL